MTVLQISVVQHQTTSHFVNAVRTDQIDGCLKVLNTDEFKPAELAKFDYCGELSSRSCQPWYGRESSFEDLLTRVSQGVYFVESLSYAELLALAKERLRKAWSHEVAKAVLFRVRTGFDAVRSFIKAKDKEVKLSGYEDLEGYNLGRILRLEDFETEDGILISEGMPLTNFRLARSLEKVTDEHGLLKLTESIRDFQVVVSGNGSEEEGSLVYNCRADRDKVRLIPRLDKGSPQRALARDIASCHGMDSGRYCFT